MLAGDDTRDAVGQDSDGAHHASATIMDKVMVFVLCRSGGQTIVVNYEQCVQCMGKMPKATGTHHCPPPIYLCFRLSRILDT